MNRQLLILIVTSFIFISSAFGLPQQKGPAGDIVPQWVNNPTIEGGLSAASCVKSAGQYSISRKKAVANARMALAQQVEINVKGLEKTYISQIDDNSTMESDGSFISVAKLLTNETLNGSRAVKFGSAIIDKIKHQCALVTLTPAMTKLLFDKLIDKSRRQLTAKQQEALYRDFVIHKTEEEMENVIRRFSK